MKKAIVGLFLGAAVSLSSTALGQGYVVFSTYVGTIYQPIRYASSLLVYGPYAALANSVAGGNVTAYLFYALGNTASSIDDLAYVAGSATALNTTTAPGYVTGGAVTIPGYVSGPVTFAIYAEVTSGLGAGALRGLSSLWVEPSLSVQPSSAGFFSQNVPDLTLGELIQRPNIPEPYSISLMSISILALLLRRRESDTHAYKRKCSERGMKIAE